MTLKTHFQTGLGLSLLLGGMAIPKIDALDISPGAKIGLVTAILVGVTAGSVYCDIDYMDTKLNAEEVLLQWESKLDHRGIVHTLINVVGVSLPFLLLAFLLNKVTSIDLTWLTVLGISMSVGCVWHMLLDTLTPKGIMWLYPITVYRFRIPIVRNYIIERFFRIIVTGLLLYWAVPYWAMVK